MKYALVTGGSRGIGRAVCLKLAEMGYHILINYQSNDTEAEATLQQIREQGSDGELMKFDVTDAVATHAALNGWMEKHPDTYIEVLVNNAGIRRDNLMLWMEQDEWSRVLDISLNGFFNVTQPLLKNMLVKRFGRIINIVSLSGIKGMPGQTNYSAAKGGIIAATKALAQEVAKKHVTVNAIAPGFIQTPWHENRTQESYDRINRKIALHRFGEIKDVADMAYSILTNHYMNGSIVDIHGGYDYF